MTRADAYYQMLLPKCGFVEQFDTWFDFLLETEKPITEDTLGLIGKGNDVNALISYLDRVSTGDKSEYEACQKVRLFFRDEYAAGRLSTKKCAEHMYTVSVFNQNFEESSFWLDMYNVTSDYDLAEIGILEMSEFEKMLVRYLETGEYIRR